MVRKVNLAVTSLNQWSMDFSGNCERIKQSIRRCFEMRASYRLGSELEVTGYGCEDHFYENDTILHSWEVLAELLTMNEAKTMICDVGMPIIHKTVRYNCRVIFLHKQIVLIRPKLVCCNEGNFRELRWFVPWLKRKQIDDFVLPDFIQEITGQKTVPIGDAVIQTKDTCIGSEVCEEMFTLETSHCLQAMDGVEIFTNGSGSHFNLRKSERRWKFASAACLRAGGVYMLSNQVGCDGGRLYYDGASLIGLNGELLTVGPQCSFDDVNVTMATVDLDDVTSYRCGISSNSISSSMATTIYPRVSLSEFSLSVTPCDPLLSLSPVIPWKSYKPEEEISMAGAGWLWDYLRRSGQSGFFLPLSGGVDSSSVACIVFSMCSRLYEEIESGNKQVICDVRKVVNDESFIVTSPEQLCNKILTTCYMASENSSVVTRQRSASLATRINSNHMNINIDGVVHAVLMVFTAATGFIPRFKARDGSIRENLALQNIQARSRMVLAYLFAQLMQWVRGNPGGLLVLGSSNVDESLRGYYTKYDCSSADLNPIGGISKTDLRSFIIYFSDKYNVPEIKEIVEATPTAELEPLEQGKIAQTDEADMGMTYDELSTFGKLRKISMCGPYSMFMKLVTLWKDKCTPSQVAEKVKHFFVTNSINRHKMTTLTPSMHAENYSPDDNRFDLRPFLYNAKWPWQFRKIDDVAQKLESKV
ncbi:glutamine-dependent NAD(+) synthetase [Ciona intestinalis]